MTKAIVIASGKGGVGKTTTAINIGTALIYFGRSAVVVDANLRNPNVGLHLGSPVTPTHFHDVLKQRKGIGDALYRHHSGLRIIPADISYEASQEDLHKKIPDVLIELTGKVDYVIIDSPPGLGSDFREVVKCADEVVIVTTPDMPSITDSLKTIRYCEEKGIKVSGVIVNKIRGDNNELVDENIQALLEKRVLGKISHDEAVREALNIKHPVCYSHPNTKASNNFKEVTAQLLGERYMESIEKKERSGLFNYVLRALGLRNG